MLVVFRGYESRPLEQRGALERSAVRARKLTRFAGCDDALLSEARERFGVVSPFGGPTSSGMLTLHCPPARVHALATFLRDKGAENVAVADIEYVFAKTNALFAKLEAGLA